MTDNPGAEPPVEAPAAPSLGSRLKAAMVPPTAVHWGWWAAGLGMGLVVSTIAFSLTANHAAPAAQPASAQFETRVKEAILANPDIIPQAINRLQQREVEKLLASNRTAIETPYSGAWAGARDADVVLVEFFDFNCPYCRQSAADVDRLLAEDPRLKVVFRDMPVLGPDSERFARASLSAADQGRYHSFYRSVFKGQGALSQERLIRHTRAAGLDEAKVARALGDKAIAAEIEKNIGLGRALGLTGTPSYVIGNQILSGAPGYEKLKEAVAEARKRDSATPA